MHVNGNVKKDLSLCRSRGWRDGRGSMAETQWKEPGVSAEQVWGQSPEDRHISEVRRRRGQQAGEINIKRKCGLEDKSRSHISKEGLINSVKCAERSRNKKTDFYIIFGQVEAFGDLAKNRRRARWAWQSDQRRREGSEKEGQEDPGCTDSAFGDFVLKGSRKRGSM